MYLLFKINVPNVHKSTKNSILNSYIPVTQIKNYQHFSDLVSCIFMVFL